jgi:hypothetical protein
MCEDVPERFEAHPLKESYGGAVRGEAFLTVSKQRPSVGEKILEDCDGKTGTDSCDAIVPFQWAVTRRDGNEIAPTSIAGAGGPVIYGPTLAALPSHKIILTSVGAVFNSLQVPLRANHPD